MAANKTESKVTKTVRDGVVKAIHTGEDIAKTVGIITKEIIKTTKDEDMDTKEKAQKLAKEALEGVKEGYKKAQPPTEEFVKKASKSIFEAFKEYAPKVAHFTKDVFEGIVDGTKEVLDESKKKPEEKEEE